MPLTRVAENDFRSPQGGPRIRSVMVGPGNFVQAAESCRDELSLVTPLVLAAVLAGLAGDDPPEGGAAPPAPAAAPAAPTAPAAATEPAPPSAGEPAPSPGLAPPPNPAAGERPDGRLDPLPKRRWRLVPEILLAPLRGIFWVIRLPTEPALKAEDRHHPFARFLSWITWSDGQRGLRPAFSFSTVFIPEFGLSYFDNLSLGVDTRLNLTATVGGGRYVSAAFSAEPTRTYAPVGVTFDAVFDRRADLLFNGLGNHTYSNFPTSRYLMNALEVRVAVRLRLLPWLAAFGAVSTGLKRFGNGQNIGGDPEIFTVYDPTTIQGFSDGTTFIRSAVGLVLDARDQVGRTAAGVVGSVVFDWTEGIHNDRASYPRLRGSLGVPINLWRHTHVLWLGGAFAMAWNHDDTLVPFSELPTLGGPDTLRGFRRDDFRDYTSLFFTAEYRWPVSMWLDAALFVDYGGVFAENFDHFGARRMQPDLGVALRLLSTGHFYMRMQLGYGFGEGVNFSVSGNGP
jgi:Omp85 superfamily domain